MKKLGSKKTLPELAVEQIIGYINENGLQPGDQLPNEVDLMNKLKVGRGTIRDDPLGFTVETDKTKVLMDALEVRLLIEPQMIIKTIDNISAKQLKELSDLADEIESLINKNKDYTVQDIEFHTLLARVSGNRVIGKLIPIIAGAIEQAIDVTDKSLVQETIITHRLIVEAVANKDKEGASKAMARHIQDNIDILKTI